MKSFKHIISYACDKNCSYCINEILVHNEKQNKNNVDLAEAYTKMKRKGYDHIMLSGGEPVINKKFPKCLHFAYALFNHVSIISAHNSALSNKEIELFADDILFSLHKQYLDVENIPEVNIDIPVYASMVLETFIEINDYWINPLCHLLRKGYSGATIRECYPDGKTIENVYPDGIYCPNNFSLRTHKKENCVKEDAVLLLPDLTITSQKEFV